MGGILTACNEKGPHSQIIFDSHSGRVASLAVSACGRFVATGQEGPIASTIIWDPFTGDVSKVHCGGILSQLLIRIIRVSLRKIQMLNIVRFRLS